MLDAFEQLADLAEVELRNKHRRVEIQLAFARWQEPRKDTNRLITGADVASDRKAFAIFWRKTDARSRDQRGDEAFEIEGVGDVLGLIPTDRTRRAGEQDAEGFAFLILRFATARIAKHATHFKEPQRFRLLAHIAHGGGDKPGDHARTHHRVIFAERQLHADRVAIL